MVYFEILNLEKPRKGTKHMFLYDGFFFYKVHFNFLCLVA